MTSTPRAAVRALELDPQLPPGDDERFVGFGVMGLPFRSGWCLALRSWAATTIGPPYRAVYVQNPAGEWTIQTEAPPDQSCPRYLSAAATEIPSPKPIDVTWLDAHTLQVRLGDELDWTMSLGDKPATRILRAVSSVVPDAWWASNAVLAGMGATAGPMLNAGRVRLQGEVPNRQWFQAAPNLVWPIRSASARWRGTDLGEIGRRHPQSHLADLWLPQQGLFYVGSAVFERLDPTRHVRPALTGLGSR
ncbi:hypothetical protein [Microbacterium sp. H1-D42]|uniref:hypothetical protein n=1 Tax=Microbacterium sp. H1-D42 TaxID=2925844 RepID=UPI001F532BF1|nr:hypothetical protein [Microbacterium sp. H1-D42]UNK72144.1 hypothetical protein MNR00_06795 [Microbacterium sp. H1-D42]